MATTHKKNQPDSPTLERLIERLKGATCQAADQGITLNSVFAQ
jgi:hypothetical protein